MATVARCHLDTAAVRQVYAGKDEDSFVLKPDVLDRADVLTMSESDPSYSELQDQASHLPFQLLQSAVVTLLCLSVFTSRGAFSSTVCFHR